jgi:eukaryotic-like serine/threonine-protein kinase
LTRRRYRAEDRTVSESAIIEGRYRLVRAIASGAMGTVHEAEDLKSGVHVALKMLKLELHQDVAIRRRFRREASILQALEHPGVVRILDVGQGDGDRSFMAMELLRGETLEARIDRDGQMSVAALRPIALAITEALAAVHAHGVVHGDLKPANVFLPQGEPFPVKLVDFGLSKIEGLERLTRTGELTGTPAYMAPELLTGQTELDGRVDIYALGVVLYEALTGKLPFATNRHPGAMMMEIVTGKATPLAQLRPDLAPEVFAVVAQAMAAKRDQRPKDPGTLWKALEQALR